ncbi:hypothetical protein AK812_SmicGene30918 [Symbiodinium microadriaticum]|uniref:Uncharacterized protein n=1 Tax=Symbiodinium microadriaticum TaxID=2951 RepID=A0A1Q9CY02_SYMMI|nr:hypothetical protein AK812_SmicGene30918 [Symbiodinium microadriaticum]
MSLMQMAQITNMTAGTTIETCQAAFGSIPEATIGLKSTDIINKDLGHATSKTAPTSYNGDGCTDNVQGKRLRAPELIGHERGASVKKQISAYLRTPMAAPVRAPLSTGVLSAMAAVQPRWAIIILAVVLCICFWYCKTCGPEPDSTSGRTFEFKAKSVVPAQEEEAAKERSPPPLCPLLVATPPPFPWASAWLWASTPAPGAPRIRGISEKAATEEGREALRLHDKGSGTGNFDPQTVADRQAQRCVVENLRALYGASLRVVVGEEGDLGLEDSGDGEPVEIREPSAQADEARGLNSTFTDSSEIVKVTGTLETGGAGHKACGGVLRDRSGGRICYDPDTSMGNSEGVLAGADEALKLPEKSLRAFCVEEDGVPVPEALILKRAAPRDSLHVALYTRDQGVQIPEIFYEETTDGGCFLLMEDLIDKSFHKEPAPKASHSQTTYLGSKEEGCSPPERGKRWPKQWGERNQGYNQGGHGGSYGGGYGQPPWHVWQGAYSPRMSRPQFDKMILPSGSAISDSSSAQTEEPSHSALMREVQKSLSQARKADHKVRRLREDKKKKAAQWELFVKESKEAFLAEKRRFQTSIEKIEEDIRTATEAGKDSSSMVQALVLRGLDAKQSASAPMLEEDQAWEDLMKEAEAPTEPGFFSEALKAAERMRMPRQQPVHPDGRLMTQEAAARILQMAMASMPPEHMPTVVSTGPPPGLGGSAGPSAPPMTAPSGPAEPYMGSPSTRDAELLRATDRAAPSENIPSPSPPSSLKPSRQRIPVKGAPLQPVHTGTGQAASLAGKLEAKRDAMRPFGIPSETAFQATLNGQAFPTNILTGEDSDVDLAPANTDLPPPEGHPPDT